MSSPAAATDRSIKRVLVCGCSGSGKSTLARAIADRFTLPFVSLDALYWLPGWRPGGDERLVAKAAPLLAEDRWVVDGNYFTALAKFHLPRATHVAFFDLPRLYCLTSILRRIASTYGQTRPEMAPGCPERIDWEFLLYIWRYRKNQRPKLLKHFEELRPDQMLLHFHDRQAAWRWLNAVPLQDA